MALEGVLGQYIHRQSVLHALDPRVKLLLLLGCIILAFIANSIIALGICYLLLIAMIILSRITAKVVGKAMAPLLIIMLFPLIFNVFFVGGGAKLAQLGPILITTEGVYLAIYMSLRLFFLFATATMFTLTTSSIAISDAVRALLQPLARFGVPAVELSMMVSIALRFIPTLVASYEDIRAAQQARGADFTEMRLMARLRGVVAILVPLFAQVFRQAEELAIAMESRCFHGGERTHYRQLQTQSRDYTAIVVVAAVALLLIALRLML